jgi:hypothetical protein
VLVTVWACSSGGQGGPGPSTSATTSTTTSTTGAGPGGAGGSSSTTSSVASSTGGTGVGGGGTGGSGSLDAGADTAGGGGAGGGNMGTNLTVVSVEPVARTVVAPVNAPIVIHFDRPVKRDSVTSKSLWAFGRWGGPVRAGAYAFSDGDKAVTLTPPRAWPSGDRVTVVLSHDLQGADGSKLRSQGYSFQYTTVTQPANLMFSEIGRLTSRTTTDVPTRTYGASVSDLNGDGFLDLLTINEDSADLRIFMNKGDASGSYLPFVKPSTPLDARSSPSETTDFNGDGIVDLVTANLNANNLSILLGKGDGTFTPSQKPRVGGEPRGVAVLDVDGDGDIDIVNTNADGDNVSLLLNDGTGKFPTTEAQGIVFFDATHGGPVASQEFGLFTGDMNEDGILDLVIGCRGRDGNNAGVVVNTGNGDGTFAFASMQGPQTSAWQLAVGDVNGDGHDDVVTADADLTATLSRNTATVLTGDGKGKLTALPPFSGSLNRPFAVDLGDLDGDKDLDVVVSNFRGNWEILLNDGKGKLTQNQSFPPAKSASCAILIDIDNDRDLDLVVVDEEEDQVVVLRQGAR